MLHVNGAATHAAESSPGSKVLLAWLDEREASMGGGVVTGKLPALTPRNSPSSTRQLYVCMYVRVYVGHVVEIWGLDPRASCMRSKHSTKWPKPPRAQPVGHVHETVNVSHLWHCNNQTRPFTAFFLMRTCKSIVLRDLSPTVCRVVHHLRWHTLV